MPKSFDQAYFDHWYRSPKHRVSQKSLLQRKARLALAVAEYHLGHPVRSVLDVGCGEGVWRAVLLAERPNLNYRGIDASDYAVARYGSRRNLSPLRFGQLGQTRFGAPVDLLVCADLLHYLEAREIRQGLAGFAELCDGVAFVEVFARGDDFVGDHLGFMARPATWYRKQLRAAGFSAAGGHCYLSLRLTAAATALELL